MRHAFLVPALFLLAGCSDAGGSGDDVTDDSSVGSAIVVSGRLVQGDQFAASRPRSLAKRLSGDPLAGYQLYCVTFATPPTAAAGIADADGQVSIQIDAAGIPLGCFVLDTGGIAVATLIFDDGGQTGQTVTLALGTDMGEITVDLDNGVALAPIDGDIADSAGMPCPLGTWKAAVPREDCTGTTARFTISQEPDGGYLVSFILGPVWESGPDACVDICRSGIPATVNDGTWTIEFPHDPLGCPSRMMTVAMTPNQACTEIAVESTYGPCESCSAGECGCESGTQTCTGTFTAARD
ncbi:MAG TPA: hypothetical protein PKH54_08480 [Myxococcota bacterium]|nr:hypothetical protein [Myxococcota bacterium]HOH77524.1 hypothetical protein [Myxococcota bacterium]